MKLSVLDYGLRDEGVTPSQALLQTVQLAQHAEKLGFHRFWVAEHHNVHALTISRPELVMMHLLNQTKTIRIGSGGIMALHHSSYKTAEVIKTLASLFPNRLDIGLGNSLGTALVQDRLRSVYTSADYKQVLEELQAYLTDDEGLEVLANPTHVSPPPLWLLGMSERSAQLAGQLGLGYTYGIFPFVPQISLSTAQTVVKTYRQQFQPSDSLMAPHVILAVFVAIADTSQAAEDLAKSMDVWFLGKEDFNAFKAFPSLHTALTYPVTQAERHVMLDQRQHFLVGTKEQVAEQLAPLLEAIKPDELLMIPLVAGFDNRVKSLDFLSQLSL